MTANQAILPDEIIVTTKTDRSFIPVLHRAAGLICADTRSDSHGRLAALELGLPAIVSVTEGIEGLKDGMHVVMDSKRGIVFERPPALWRSPDEDS